MNRWYHRYKPAASCRTHLVTAAIMWTVVGASLLTVGVAWSRSASPIRLLVILAIAAGLGVLKARFVLRKSATRIVRRIQARGDGRCLGGFVSWRTWIMVAIMMLLGRALRSGLLRRSVVAFIYEAVGVALLVGAGTLWSSVASYVGSRPRTGSSPAEDLPPANPAPTRVP